MRYVWFILGMVSSGTGIAVAIATNEIGVAALLNSALFGFCTGALVIVVMITSRDR